MLFLYFQDVLFSLLNFILQIFLFFKGTFTPCPSHFTFHQLYLIFCIIKQFLLSLELLIQFVDMRLQIPTCRYVGLYFSIQICLLLPILKQLLSGLEQLFLLDPYLLLQLTLLLVVHLVTFLRYCTLLFELHGYDLFDLKFLLFRIILFLGIIESLLLDQQLLAHETAFVLLLLQFRGECTQLVFEYLYVSLQTLQLLFDLLILASLLNDLTF